MKILGYCTLWAIALALLVAVCAILKDSVVRRDVAGGNPAAAGKLLTHVRNG